MPPASMKEFTLFLRLLKAGDVVWVHADSNHFQLENGPEILSPAPEFNGVQVDSTHDWIKTVFNPIFAGPSGLVLDFAGLRNSAGIFLPADKIMEDLGVFGLESRHDNMHIIVYRVASDNEA